VNVADIKHRTGPGGDDDRVLCKPDHDAFEAALATGKGIQHHNRQHVGGNHHHGNKDNRQCQAFAAIKRIGDGEQDIAVIADRSLKDRGKQRCVAGDERAQKQQNRRKEKGRAQGDHDGSARMPGTEIGTVNFNDQKRWQQQVIG
jgi:hypothetical protein